MIEQLSAPELSARLEQVGESPVILDVREPWETQVCQIAGATHIPMREIPARLGELCQEKEIVVLCHHGVRSQHVANFLAQQGFQKLFNLRGGIDAWAKEVDPAMAKY